MNKGSGKAMKYVELTNGALDTRPDLRTEEQRRLVRLVLNSPKFSDVFGKIAPVPANISKETP